MSSNPNTNKRQRRPWDMGCSFQDQLDRAEAVLAVPSVIVDGTVYKSDRFYLHALLGEEENLQQQPQQQQPQQQQQQHQCHCGSQQPPPLFHREKFVHSLDLKAAILGTYTIDLEYMMDQFPSLVGPNSTVPTLILHGHRGLMNQINQQNEWKTTTTTSVIQQEHDQKKQKDNHHHNHHHHNPATRKQPSLDFRLPLFSPTTKNNEDIDAGTCTSGDDDDEESFQSQEDHNNNNNNTTKWTDFHSPPQQQQQQQRARPSMPVDRPNTTTSSLDLDELLSRKNTNQEPTTTNTTTATTTTTTTTTTCFLGEQCHLTQVVSAWTPPKNSKVTHEQDDETPAPNNNHLPEYKKGVHHPKFMLLFESSGDLIVVVSTANLSPTQNTTEGSWIQRFRKRKHQQQRPHHHHHHRHHHHIPSSSLNTCDFGPVLLDFIQKLSQSSTLGPKPEIFLSKYLTFDLKDIIHRFHFDKAQVHLVPGVPGEHRDNVKKKKQRLFLYGRQRVQSILNNIPYLVQSKKDSLILQPTSFGANWKRGDLADVVRSYLNYNDKEHKDFWNDQALLEKVQILWPSQSFVGENNHNSRRRPTTTKPETTTTTPAAVAVAAVETRDSCLFLSSRIFNSCDVPCISRMALYQTSDPPQRPLSLVPHFKSAARLLKKREVIETKLSSSNSTAKEYFSWFLLTSACFSHGAQGQRMTSSSSSSSSADGNKRSKTVVSYANFELGVLFTSQWKQIGRGGRKNDRVYCFEPKECSCCHHQQQQQQQSYSYMSSKLIHLPVPYSLYPYGYFESEDDEMMQETPSFHEITDDSRCVGNMLLTPYGISQQSKKAKRVY